MLKNAIETIRFLLCDIRDRLNDASQDDKNDWNNAIMEITR